MTRAQRLLSLPLILGIVACARIQLPVASAADVARAQSRWPDITAAELEQGRALYRARCSGCHLPQPPQSQPAEAWPSVIAEMGERANVRGEDAQLIERYLVTMSVADRPPTAR